MKLATTVSILALLIIPAQAQVTDYMGTYGDGTSYGTSTTYPSYTVPGYQPLTPPFDPVVPPAVTIQPQPNVRFDPAFRTPGQPLDPFRTRR